MPNIVFFVSDGYTEFNSSNYRVSIPVGAFFRAGLRQNVRIMHIAHWILQTQEGVAVCSWADVIVLQRVLVDESIKHGANWTQKGKRVLVDFDDAYDMIRDDNAAYKFWGEGTVEIVTEDGHKYDKVLNEHPVSQFRKGLRYITGFTAPSKQLIRDWEKFAPGAYMPNYLDMPRYAVPKRTNPYIVIGWGGSLSHIPGYTDSGVAEALGMITSERDDVRFLLVGDERVKPHLPIPSNRLLFSPYVKYTLWPYVLKRYDIGIAPLYGEYDCRRSHLKVMEYIAMGIPFVATDSVVYDEFMHAQSGIFVPQGERDKCLENSIEGWYGALNQMIDNIKDYSEQAKTCIDEFEEVYNVDKNVERMMSVYEDTKVWI